MDSFLTPYGLSNSGEEKLQLTPFGGVSKLGCSDGLCAGIIESHNFFVLGPILVKFHIPTRLNRELFNDIWPVEVGRRKVALHTSSHLTPIEVWQSAAPPLRRVAEFRARNWQIPVRRFWGVGKIWRPCDLRSRSYKRLNTHTHTRTHAHTHAHKAINIIV